MKIDLYLEEVSRLTDTVCGNESDSRRNKIRGESRVGSGQDTCETSKWIDHVAIYGVTRNKVHHSFLQHQIPINWTPMDGNSEAELKTTR